MSNDWGIAAVILGAGGLLAWNTLTPESKAKFWTHLADGLASRPVEYPIPAVRPQPVELRKIEHETPASRISTRTEDLIAAIEEQFPGESPAADVHAFLDRLAKKGLLRDADS